MTTTTEALRNDPEWSALIQQMEEEAANPPIFYPDQETWFIQWLGPESTWHRIDHNIGPAQGWAYVASCGKRTDNFAVEERHALTPDEKWPVCAACRKAKP